MATLKTISSGSHGNCYILECDNEQLIIELGVSWKDILKGLDYDLSKVMGCLCSHKHLDHSMSIPNAIKFGLSVYSCQEVKDIHIKTKVLKKGVKIRLGEYLIQPIPLQHSCECYGFLISHPMIGKMVFATDCMSIPYRFKNVNHFIIEANNDVDEMIDNLCNNDFSMSQNENHMEISNTIDFLKHNYSSEIQSVVLIHLSDTNINANKVVTKVKNELGFDNVHVAKKGLEIPLMLSEF